MPITGLQSKIIRVYDRLGCRVVRFMSKRYRNARAVFGARYGNHNCEVDSLIFELVADEIIDWSILVFGALPGGRDRTLALQTLRSGDVVFDVGANVGHCALPFARAVGPKGKVYAFEPNPQMVARLSRHLEINRIKNVIILPFAIGAEHGIGELRMPRSDNPGEATLLASTEQVFDVGTSISVTIDRLDKWVADQGIEKLDFVKVDVEGFERFVLKGGRKTLTKFRPRMMVEAVASIEQHVDALLTDLDELGYDTFKTVIGSNRLLPVCAGRRYNSIFEVHCIPRA